MSKSFRIILFLFFLFGFLISAPILVLYTAGYRFDLAHGRIVHTAVLNIFSEPRGATVTVDDTAYADKTPAVLETILPGKHTVWLEKEGYLSWETQLEFKSREALVIGPILLFLQEEPALLQSINAIQASVHGATDRFVYATQERSWLEVWRVDASSAQTKLLMRLPYTATNLYTFSWSENGTYIMLVEEHDSRKDIFASRVRDGATVDLPSVANGVKDAWWDMETESTLYVESETSISQINVETLDMQTLGFTASRVSSFQRRPVTVSQSHDRATISFQDEQTASIIAYLPLGAYEFVSAPENLIALFDTRHQRLILLDPNNREQPILFNEEAMLWKWNSSQDVLIYSSGYDVKRYIRSSHETQTITRLSTPLGQLDWFAEGTGILYQAGGEVVAMHLEDSTILSRHVLATNLSGPFWISRNNKQLFALLETQTGWEWWTRNLRN